MHQIGQVAETVGLSLRTIRYFQEVGLVPPSGRSRVSNIKRGAFGRHQPAVRKFLVAHDLVKSRKRTTGRKGQRVLSPDVIRWTAVTMDKVGAENTASSRCVPSVLIVTAVTGLVPISCECVLGLQTFWSELNSLKTSFLALVLSVVAWGRLPSSAGGSVFASVTAGGCYSFRSCTSSL